jgi:hypothetical protein
MRKGWEHHPASVSCFNQASQAAQCVTCLQSLCDSKKIIVDSRERIAFVDDGRVRLMKAFLVPFITYLRPRWNQRRVERLVLIKGQFCFLVGVFSILFSMTARADTYTYPQLVKRMTDLQGLANLPPPGEKTSLASSYDRTRQYDAATDKYLHWSSNGDRYGIIRQEGDESVFADIKSPGCIWRIWSAQALDGHVKIYLDGATTPTVDLPFKDYFDGTIAPFNRSNLVYSLFPIPGPEHIGEAGHNNYTPISFQKSCKIVADKGWGAFYQFTYTQFPAGTIVPTFNMNLSPVDSTALDHANQLLGRCGQNPTPAPPKTITDSVPITVNAGQTMTVADLKGEGAVNALKVKLILPDDPEAARILLRQLTVSITWEDEALPAVWSPLGDFFGYVGGGDKFQSLPVGLLSDGTFYSYWYMPYRKNAHIEVGNDGPQPVAMTWQVSHAPLDEPIKKLARFHAKWHRNAFLPKRLDRKPDWTLLVTQGQGRYVGTHLHGWNPRGGWWGEGDEKFFIDGEKFPSSLGTGSEDYFGYAWGVTNHYSRPYHNQILNEGNAGHFDENRWHIPDSLPFQTSFEGAIEKYSSDERSTFYAAEAFWYLNEGGTDPYSAVPVADRIGYWVRPEIYHEPGVIEGEYLRSKTKIPFQAGPRDMVPYGKGWSNDQELHWNPDKMGDTDELELPAQKAGTYRLEARFTKGPNLGIFQANFNGLDLGSPTDLYAPNLTVNDVTDLGAVTLVAGNPILKITLIGKNAASKGTGFGLDYLKFVSLNR